MVVFDDDMDRRRPEIRPVGCDTRDNAVNRICPLRRYLVS
jgi:hypothetical protein